ncbi:MAG: glycine zipper 2TM domain-containing protein [Sphingomonas sp.]|uniref:glycine zipper 2TM domain-containing protein n=1 Tax=Sphingomonas sp. TaxID=28214 RepID=UPI003F7FD5E3
MIRSLPIAAIVLSSIAIPATAQTASEQRRWEMAQRRYDTETSIYERARADYEAAQRRDRRYGYNDQRYDDGRYATDYDASRYYRDGPQYQERVLTSNDQVYRGSDGRYYCKRSDGTTGLIVGGAAGGIIGNVIDGGRNRVAGTLIGGALGAILGKKVDQSNSDYRCR